MCVLRVSAFLALSSASASAPYPSSSYCIPCSLFSSGWYKNKTSIWYIFVKLSCVVSIHIHNKVENIELNVMPELTVTHSWLARVF